METPENTARMEQCPSFEGCSAPKCPLDQFMTQRFYYLGEPKCVANLSTRVRLGKDLPNLGVLPRQLNGFVRFYGSIDKVKEVLLTRFVIASVENKGQVDGSEDYTRFCKHTEAFFK